MQSIDLLQPKSIFERTLGFELEIPDVERAAVNLPEGYSWSMDEQITNTDGKKYTAHAKFGGEINTRPLRICQKDREELRNLLQECYANGGKIAWGNGYDMHIYAGDLSIEQIKNIWILGYYTDRFIRRVCDLGEWFQYPTMLPTPTYQYLEKIRQVEDFTQLKNVLANSSNKGFIRHPINVCSLFKHKTIEFRIFNTSYDFKHVENSVLFAYRFLYYGMSHTEEDFKKIKTYDDFCKVMKIRYELAPKCAPMIFAGDQNEEFSRMTSPKINYTSAMVKSIVENVKGTICCVNPGMYSLELALKHNGLDVVIYNQDEFHDLLWKIANGALQLHWTGDFAFLEDYNDGTPQSQMAILMFVHKVHNVIGSDLEYKARIFNSVMQKIDENMSKARQCGLKLISLLTSARYVFGNLNMAIEKEDNVFFQYEKDRKANSTMLVVKKNTDYSETYVGLPTDYYDFVERIPKGKTFYMVSYNQFLFNLHKLVKIDKAYLYSNVKKEGVRKVLSRKVEGSTFSIEEPPSDLIIDDPNKLKIVQVKPVDFANVQHAYVKKVHKFMLPKCAFLVMYDKWCLGAFGFSWPKKDPYDLWLLSDFCTNNDIPRLAKLILMCILSKPVHKMINRWRSEMSESLYTKVYTSLPVSMKYRGIFKKNKELCSNGSLFYEGRFGSEGSFEDIIKKYKKMVENNGK